jgi:isopenicillin-N epimerase
MPVEALGRAARVRGIAVCVDGPHAPAHVDVNLDRLQCDFYTASCHKWLSAPFGTGFLYVHPRWQHRVRPLIQSWGRLLPNQPTSWDEAFIWSGTRDPSGYLAVPAAIEFLTHVGLDKFRERTHFLARAARHRLAELWRQPDIVPDSPDWYGSMAQVRLPPGDWSNLQLQLWEQYGMEVPVVHFADRWHLRISCHLYTMLSDVERLVKAVSEL